MNCGVFLHSPFSQGNVVHGSNRNLLLQFLLSEIFESKKNLNNQLPSIYLYEQIGGAFYPLDWSSQRGSLNKIQEHFLLLCTAFSEFSQSLLVFKHSLTNTIHTITQEQIEPQENFLLQLSLYLKQMYITLEPLIQGCKEDENVIFFLLKNHEVISQITSSSYLLSFLQKNCGESIDLIGKFLCDRFHKRGFSFLIPQINNLLSSLLASHATIGPRAG